MRPSAATGRTFAPRTGGPEPRHHANVMEGRVSLSDELQPSRFSDGEQYDVYQDDCSALLVAQPSTCDTQRGEGAAERSGCQQSFVAVKPLPQTTLVSSMDLGTQLLYDRFEEGCWDLAMMTVTPYFIKARAACIRSLSVVRSAVLDQ